ncbi:hypothetical protein FHR84_003254 [Actinopolyspora biskrensis]|uniref:Uncharacterized protein n=1 Tax=Actinopolyspora biskrensis TaxID=1470178 RepID=A0A852Z3N5_9ACTN|nr:hypothetical protein [Actinopolyspora biskrensis]NYH79905.1 hypothetical protein [Actinopolyspora biskrensis]
MTRQELADAVNVQVYRMSGEITTIDDNHIGKWERGDIRWPAARYRAALRALLDVATDADLGFRRSRGRCNSGDVDRKTFLKTTLGLGAGATVMTGGSAPTGHADELAVTVAGATQHYRRMESTVSSQHLAPAVEGHLRLATEVVQGKLRNPTGFGVLSEVAGLSAWLAADRGDTATARRRYTDSIRYAESAQHPLLVSYMIASLGYYAVEIGDLHQGLTLLGRAASYLDDRTSPPARAWLSSLCAVGHAAVGDHASTTKALRTAETLADREPGEAQWPWMFAFTSAKVARYQSSALARLGDVTGARSAYHAVVSDITAPKARALAQVEHAHLLAITGYTDEACTLACEALATGKQYASERIVTKVRTLRRELPPRSGQADVLDDDLIGLYGEGQA